MSQSGIYRIMNQITGECYVGASARIRDRFGGHRGLLRRKQHYNKKLQESFDQYGELVFAFEVVELIPPGLDPLETQRWMAERERFHVAAHALTFNEVAPPKPLPDGWHFNGHVITSAKEPGSK